MGKGFLSGIGFRQEGVRDHGDVTGIEVELYQLEMIMESDLREAIARRSREIGFL